MQYLLHCWYFLYFFVNYFYPVCFITYLFDTHQVE